MNGTHSFSYQNANGKMSDLEVQGIERNGKTIYVLSEAVGNHGPGFDDPGMRDGAAHDLCIGIQASDRLQPEDVLLYQQRPDGDFERVDFRTIGRDISMSDEQPNQFTESHREIYTREELENTVGEVLTAPESPIEAGRLFKGQQWQELESSGAIERGAVSDEELAQHEAKVEGKTLSPKKDSHGFDV